MLLVMLPGRVQGEHRVVGEETENSKGIHRSDIFSRRILALKVGACGIGVGPIWRSEDDDDVILASTRDDGCKPDGESVVKCNEVA